MREVTSARLRVKKVSPPPVAESSQENDNFSQISKAASALLWFRTRGESSDRNLFCPRTDQTLTQGSTKWDGRGCQADKKIWAGSNVLQSVGLANWSDQGNFDQELIKCWWSIGWMEWQSNWGLVVTTTSGRVFRSDTVAEWKPAANFWLFVINLILLLYENVT